MFDDENLPRKTEYTIPRKLDAMSIESLKEYIDELRDEIGRVKDEITKRRSFILMLRDSLRNDNHF